VDHGNGNDVRGPYETPYPLDDRHFLVSKNGTVIARDYAGTEQAVVVRPRDGMWFVNAVPLKARPVPPVIPSHLPSIADGENTATVFIQDIYKGLEPHVKRGVR
jgi:hypothetical protein